VSKLDSKTAKTGDSVVVQTKSSAKTADGTEIPKGSKLVGHVIGAQPSGAGENSQVALLFDHSSWRVGRACRSIRRFSRSLQREVRHRPVGLPP
jgi:hypothetical protein